MRKFILVVAFFLICFQVSSASAQKIRVRNICDISQQPWLMKIIAEITETTDFASSFPRNIKIICHQEIRDFMEKLDFQNQDTEDISNFFYMSIDYCADKVWANHKKQ